MPLYHVVMRPRAKKQLAHNPRPLGCKKLVGSDLYRVRVGDYRILYVIEDDRIIITIARVAHRKEAYQK